ncbi:MAG TPA: metallophosphoesterase [Candidimonas sp.]|nr:metallophosphoesterase [Candidimonas sp.]
MLLHYEQNLLGRDFAVGDIHGHFSKLQIALDRMGFNPKQDRLFAVGDLVDRGPESEQVIDWLNKPWFHGLKGNHEDIAIRYAKGNAIDPESYRFNGGGWFMDLAHEEQQRYAQAFCALPMALEVETAAGLVGLVHADCPERTWSTLDDALRASRATRDFCMWSRNRVQTANASRVDGVRAVVVGHTPLATPLLLGNVYHIDTGGWTDDGYFTLLNLQSLDLPPRAE